MAKVAEPLGAVAITGAGGGLGRRARLKQASDGSACLVLPCRSKGSWK